MLEFLPSTAEITWYVDFTDNGYQEAMYKIIRRLLKIFQHLNFKVIFLFFLVIRQIIRLCSVWLCICFIHMVILHKHIFHNMCFV